MKYFTLSPLPLETLLPFPRGKGLWRVQNFVPLPLPLHTLGLCPQGFVNPWHSLTIEHRSGRGGSILGVLFPGILLMGSSGQWIRGCSGSGPSKSVAGVAGVLWSGQRGLTGASRVIWGEGDEGGVGVSSLGNGGTGRDSGVGFAVRYRSGVAGAMFCMSQCTALRGTETVVNFGCFGSGPYIVSMSVVSPRVSERVRSSVFPVKAVRGWVYKYSGVYSYVFFYFS